MQEVLSRTSTRATANFGLASKLAEKIGQQQAEIMGLLASTSNSSSSSNRDPASGSVSPPVTPTGSGFYSYSRGSRVSERISPSSAPSSPSSSTSSKGSPTSKPDMLNASTTPTSFSKGSSSSSGSAGGGEPRASYEAPWERSLREARQRVVEAEAQAASAGAAAGLRAQETIEVRSTGHSGLEAKRKGCW